MKLKRPITRSCETKNPELEMKKAFKLQGAVIRYSPNSGVVPYFSEILPLYLLDGHFPRNSQSPEPYRHPLGVPYDAPPCTNFTKLYLLGKFS